MSQTVFQCPCPNVPSCSNFLVPTLQEHWYTSYIDLLQRFRLWNVSNEVVKLSTSQAVSCLNQASTTLHVNCSHCKRPMSSRGWVCDRWGYGGSSLGALGSPKTPAEVLYCLQVPPLCQHVCCLPPRGQGSVRVVPGLQPRRPPATHHEVVGGQLPVPCRLWPSLRVLLICCLGPWTASTGAQRRPPKTGHSLQPASVPGWKGAGT